MKMMKLLPIFLFFGLFITAGCSSNLGSSAQASQYDNFAKCLTANGIKMYGAYWCPHCNNQKQMFGSSFQYVHYIECSLSNRAGQTQECSDAGIKAYPTWDFNGKRVEGELSFEQLSQLSNCNLG